MFPLDIKCFTPTDSGERISYSYTILLAIVVLLTLDVKCFTPTDSGERISYSNTILLAIVVLLTVVSDT